MTKSLIFGMVCGLAIIGIMIGGSPDAASPEHFASADSRVFEMPLELEPVTVFAPKELADPKPADLGVMEIRIDAEMYRAEPETDRPGVSE